MKTISQRQLRNDNAEIIRGAQDGESYLVTRRGVPVAVIGPVQQDSDLPLDRPARSRRAYSSYPRVTSKVPTADILDDLRGDR